MPKSSQQQRSFALTPGQQSIWLLQQLAPTGTVFNLTAGIEVRGPGAKAAARKVVDRLSRRHELLRTRVFEQDGKLNFEAEAFSQPDIELIDGKDWSVDAFNQYVAGVQSQPIDLRTSPPLRVRMVSRPGGYLAIVMTLHHIVADEWSAQLCFRDVERWTKNLTLLLKPIDEPARFSDYRIAESNWLTSSAADNARDYWSSALAGANADLGLPTDFARTEAPSFAGETVPVHLGAALSNRIAAFAKQQKLSRFSVLFAAWQIFMARLTGQSDIAIATPFLNRRREFMRTLGLFSNPVVLRLDLKKTPTFVAAAKSIAKQVIDGRKHQRLPFEEVVKLLGTRPDPEALPFQQASFNFRRGGASDGIGAMTAPHDEAVSVKFGPWALRGLAMPIQPGHTLLALDIFDAGGVIDGYLKFQTDRLSEPTVSAWRDSFVHLVTHLIEQPEETWTNQPLTARSSDQSGPALTGTDWSELYESNVQSRPDQLAVINFSDQQTQTYGDLDAAAKKFAAWVKNQKSDGYVALCLERNVELPSRLLGLLCAGIPFVPIDPVWPESRVRRVLSDSGATLLLLEGKRHAIPTDIDELRLIRLDDEDVVDDIASTRATTLRKPVGDMPAYLVYTSGSTGAPAGIVTARRNLSAFVEGFVAGADLAGQQTFLARTSLVFDPVIVELVIPFVTGGHIVLLDHDDRNDPAAVVRAVREHDVQVLQSTPSFWPMLLAEGLSSNGSLRVLSGGEALGTAIARQLAAAGLDVWNTYGPTETTVWATAGRWDPSARSVSLGRPIPGVTLSVRDQFDQVLPPAVPGELWIAGAGVSPGYQNDETRTREKFVRDESGTAWYRSGDLVRWTADGELEFMGRRDLQVKVRGYRIELEEIEGTATALPSVARAAATVVEGESIVLVVEPTANFDEAALRDHLRSHLPSYYRPQRIVTLAKLPTLSTGKIARAEVAGIAETTSSEEPPSSAEPQELGTIDQELLEIWRRSLRDRGLEFGANLLAQGANSLTVMRVLSEVDERYGVRFSMRDAYDATSVRDMSVLLRERLVDKPEIDTFEVAHSPARNGLPVASLTQERLWMVTQLPGANVAYNIVGAIKGEANVNVEVLNQAVLDTMARHEMLRTSFQLSDGALRQVVASAMQLTAPLRVLDFRGPTETALAAAVNHIRHEGARHFELAEAPLFKILACNISDDHVLLAGIFHHLIFDGWSVRVIADDLIHAYTERAAGREPLFADPSRSYTEFSQWQRQWLEQGKDTQRQLDFWKQALSQEQKLIDLPLDRPRPTIPSYRGAYVSSVLPKSDLQTLNLIASENRATLFHVLFSLLTTQLWRYSNQPAQTIGVPVAGRHFSGLEEVIGCLINTLALRVNVEPSSSFAALVRSVRQHVLDALDHQDLPLTMLMEHIDKKPGRANHPLFQVVMTLQNFEHSDFTIDGTRLEEVDVPNGGAQFDLTYYLRERDDGLHCFLEYNSDLFDPATGKRILDHYLRLIRQVCEEPDSRLDTLCLMSDEERRQIESALEGPEITWPSDQMTLPGLLANHVQAGNQQLAVVAGQDRATYAQIDARANAIAAELIGRGVSKGDVVAISMERNIDLVAWLIGISRSGGAWLPLDPQFPADRVNFMLKDSGAHYLIADSEIAGGSGRDGIDVIEPEILREWESRESVLPAVTLEANDLAYLIYTSGSTGKPKGVKVSHGAFCNFLQSMIREPGINDGDALLAITTMSFDIANLEIFAPIACGARLILATDAESRNPITLAELIHSQEVTILQATPSTWRMLIDAGWAGAPIAALSGGEPLAPDLAEALLEKVGVLWNMYGPTEATVWCSCVEVTDAAQPISLGAALPNNRLFVVDEDLEPVPQGVAGELIVAGVNLAMGYHNRPAAQDERFVEHARYGRVYRTGDRVRVDRAQRLIYVGRVDDQIKLRGHRLEPAELEASIDSLDSVRESAVKLHAVKAGDDRLMAYVVPNESPLQSSDLRKALMKRLPRYMVPQHFVEVSSLPRTPNGKLDRAALKTPDLAALHARTSYAAPETELERRLAAIWSDSLGIEKIDRHDNFFELGGHSLAAVQVIAKFHKETGQIILPQALVVDQLNVIANSVERRSLEDRDNARSDQSIGNR